MRYTNSENIYCEITILINLWKQASILSPMSNRNIIETILLTKMILKWIKSRLKIHQMNADILIYKLGSWKSPWTHKEVRSLSSSVYTVEMMISVQLAGWAAVIREVNVGLVLPEVQHLKRKCLSVTMDMNRCILTELSRNPQVRLNEKSLLQFILVTCKFPTTLTHTKCVTNNHTTQYKH